MKHDLHIHSNISDGELSRNDIIKILIQKDIEVVSFTEHNSFVESPKNDQINFINGIEFDTMLECGFNLVSLHCLEKGAMWGMLDYGEHTFADRNTLYIDQQDMWDKGVFHWFDQVPTMLISKNEWTLKNLAMIKRDNQQQITNLR